MRIALDTNFYVAFCRGDEAAVSSIRGAREIFMPFITLGELRAGFACGTRATQNASVLTRFLNKPRVRVLNAAEETSHHYALLFRQLRLQGTPIPTNDLWIAALCSQHNLLLATRMIISINCPKSLGFDAPLPTFLTRGEQGTSPIQLMLTLVIRPDRGVSPHW